MRPLLDNNARVFVDTNRVIGAISPLLFSGFAEHMGRCIYGGIYEPASPCADEQGFRKDVLAELRELNFRMVRYPGGNFLSGYHWLDGIGPRDQRPRRRELAWQSIETNQFGTNEFMEFCSRINAKPMLGANLGTNGMSDASNLVEYCNAPAGTRYADMRVAHGRREPYGVEYWCLGNEMDRASFTPSRSSAGSHRDYHWTPKCSRRSISPSSMETCRSRSRCCPASVSLTARRWANLR